MERDVFFTKTILVYACTNVRKYLCLSVHVCDYANVCACVCACVCV